MGGLVIPTARPGPPLWLLAELTYRCPLHCAFCYNPVDFARTSADDELDTEAWLRVLNEARAQGSVQCGFSGGEPLVRDDLEVLVAEAHRLGYYTNLLTSGVGLTEDRAEALKRAGLDHIQLSFQDTTRELNDFLSHTRTFDLKQKVAHTIKANGWPMVMNCVIHRLNIDHVDKIIEMAVALDAEYLSWPTASITPGRCSTATNCCPRASRSSAPNASPTNTVKRSATVSASSSSSPTTTKPAPRSA